MDDTKQEDPTAGSGERRQEDRRQGDRRSTERRTPPPAWRRPWAFVAYGVAGALAIVFLFDVFGSDSDSQARAPEFDAAEVEPISVAASRPAASTNAAPVEAGSVADYERLIAEGTTARGRLVHVVLHCSSINSMELRDVGDVEPAVSAMADAAETVPAAECRWGEGSEVQPEDFVLLVPPGLAEDFANAPVVQDGFVSRRRVDAVLEWIGRSDALALRTAGVLREIRDRAGNEGGND